MRQRRPDLDEALEEEIRPAAEIALHRARRYADDGGDRGEREAEEDRNAKAIDQPRHDIAALIVGAEPIPFDIGAAAVRLARLDHARRRRLALLFRQHPGRRRGRRRRQSALRSCGRR